MKYPSENGLLLTDDSLWDIKDLSSYLKVKIKTLYTMVENGDIPHYRIGKLIRFCKAEIDAWLEREKRNFQEIKNKISKGKLNKSSINNIDSLLRKTIDRTKQEDYNSCHGRSDRIEGLKKEVKNVSI